MVFGLENPGDRGNHQVRCSGARVQSCRETQSEASSLRIAIKNFDIAMLQYIVGTQSHE